MAANVNAKPRIYKKTIYFLLVLTKPFLAAPASLQAPITFRWSGGFSELLVPFAGPLCPTFFSAGFDNFPELPTDATEGRRAAGLTFSATCDFSVARRTSDLAGFPDVFGTGSAFAFCLTSCLRPWLGWRRTVVGRFNTTALSLAVLIAKEATVDDNELLLDLVPAIPVCFAGNCLEPDGLTDNRFAFPWNLWSMSTWGFESIVTSYMWNCVRLRLV